MICSLQFGRPAPAFWEKYAQLWQESAEPSPFQAPHLLQYFASLADNEPAVFQCTEQDRLLSAVILGKSKGYFHFLSDLKTDSNFFLFHRDCQPDTTRRIFEAFLDHIRKERMTLILNNVPAWAHYAGQFNAALRACPLYHLQVNYSVCPMAAGETPGRLFNIVSASRSTRTNVNKFLKKENGAIEIRTDDSDIDAWVEDFCDNHVARWAETPTPSAYRDPEKRRFLAQCLRAWHADGILVRFAMKAGEKRIGLLIGLISGETLIYHSTTYSPEFAPISPGRTLLYFITEWMAENRLRILDFGAGNEQYKYNLADREQALQKIFITEKSNLAFIVKAQLIKTIRERPAWYGWYQQKIKPAYRKLFR
jgi:CelD/BcsL family acetyltransferase involved in cellulose biosynthesis